MHTSIYVIVAALAYLLGSIPFGYILVRLFTGGDVRAQGSGNIGATNVARTGRKGLAVATLMLDVLKGSLAVFAARFLVLAVTVRRGPHGLSVEPPSLDTAAVALMAMAIAAFAAVAGHMFPVWLKFKGGKGVATGFGVFLALAPAAVLIVVGVFIVVVALTRYVSLGSIVSAALFPFCFWLMRPDDARPAVLALVMAVAFLIVVKHKDNIGRLISGGENRLGARKA